MANWDRICDINHKSSYNELLLQAYDYVVENYDDVIDQLTSTIEEQLSDTAIEEAEAVKEEFVAEFNCVSEVGS